MERNNLICDNCKHYTFAKGCEAFDFGKIPYSITISNEHTTPIQDQTNDLVFTPRDKDFVDPLAHLFE